MKKQFTIFLCSLSFLGQAQQAELHYDFRHTVDPRRQPQNFPTFYFEYFKSKDYGSTLFKLQSDLKGRSANMGQCFVQFSQSMKFWKPKIFVSAGYSGGLGVIEATNGGFYITNSYLLGASYSWLKKNSWYTAVLNYKFAAFDRPSHDPQITFYIGKGLFNYRIIASASLIFWTQNRNQGNDFTSGLSGKELDFFGDPQLWYRLKGSFWIGSKVWMYYHVLSKENILQAYPTLGLRYKIE